MDFDGGGGNVVSAFAFDQYLNFSIIVGLGFKIEFIFKNRLVWKKLSSRIGRYETRLGVGSIWRGYTFPRL